MRRLLTVVACGVLALAAAPVADAAFPGQNGKLAWTVWDSENEQVLVCSAFPDLSGYGCRTLRSINFDFPGDPAWSSAGTRLALDGSTNSGSEDIWVANADITGATNITQDAPFAAFNHDPAWAPGDSRLTFTREFASEHDDAEVYSIAPDGSGRTNLTNHPADDGEAAPGPRGRIAIVSERGGNDDIYLMNADGSDVTRLTDDPGRDGNPNWSPGGNRITFESSRDGNSEIYVMNADGSDETRITTTPSDAEAHPIWSPDGTKIAFQVCGPNCSFTDSPSIHALNPDGSGRAPLMTVPYPDHMMNLDFDWQPLPVNTPSSHVRPIAATPIYVSLVPAYSECTGAANRTHGPPLVFPSCAPPQQTSPNLTVRAPGGDNLFKGLVRMAVRLGPPGGVDDTDVRLQASLSHVQHSSDFSEYLGELRVAAKVRVTDKEVPVSSTIQDFPLEFDVPCVSSPDPDLKSTCNIVTGLDAVIPGSSPEGTRAVWALDQVKVYDGGADEDTGTEADNSLFATQGLFVP